jgi:predicted flap endonuclease-1-like 5' DNA nuclease
MLFFRKRHGVLIHIQFALIDYKDNILYTLRRYNPDETLGGLLTNIIRIQGIGPSYAEKLGANGIKTLEKLLEAGSSKKGRTEISEKTGITEKLILEWVNLADLFRIKEIGEKYSDLLEEAGVDTVVELSKRNPTHPEGGTSKADAEDDPILVSSNERA